MTKVEHTLEPIYDGHSKTLILGSMPSETSRTVNKYYGHPQNRFWQIMSSLYETEIEDWQNFILNHRLALWDVIASCEIDKSSDSSIRNVIPNDVPSLIKETEIENIFLLGKSAYNLYNKHLKEKMGIEGIYLPSPSSANATMTLEKLIERYSIIKEVTEE